MASDLLKPWVPRTEKLQVPLIDPELEKIRLELVDAFQIPEHEIDSREQFEQIGIITFRRLHWCGGRSGAGPHDLDKEMADKRQRLFDKCLKNVIHTHLLYLALLEYIDFNASFEQPNVLTYQPILEHSMGTEQDTENRRVESWKRLPLKLTRSEFMLLVRENSDVAFDLYETRSDEDGFFLRLGLNIQNSVQKALKVFSCFFKNRRPDLYKLNEIHHFF